MHMFHRVCCAVVCAVVTLPAASAGSATLSLERKIPLGDVAGRIDHLAVDLDRGRLFVAELGNDTVDVIDLRSSALRQRIAGLDEPQGLAYLSSLQTLYVANGGDGSVRRFKGDVLMSSGTVQLGSDADNVRLDYKAATLLVGYGRGGIAIIDGNFRETRKIPLDGHPEGFQIGTSSKNVYINVPDAREVVVADRESGRVVKKFPVTGARANFPLALDEDARRLLVAFRQPPRLRIMTLEGSTVADAEICRDADDVFIDRKRHRVYVICGEGVVDVLNELGERIERIPTAPGARTGLFVSALDRLFVAAPAAVGTKAEIWIFKPLPSAGDATAEQRNESH